MRPTDHEIELEPDPSQPWCATCERWEEDCVCSLEIRAGSPNERAETDGAICERCQTATATRFVMNEHRCEPCLALDDSENGDTPKTRRVVNQDQGEVTMFLKYR